MRQTKENQPLLFVSATTLSLLGSGIGLVLFGLAALFFTPAKAWVIGITNSTSMDRITPLYFLLFMALCLLSFVGVIKIRKWQKSGLFFYLGAQLVMLFLPVIWLDWNAFSVNNLIFTTIFVFIYFSFFNRMA
ncbi:hypothetical protein [Sunxiuqinia dokdonensis]|uniref:Uncharacterized protein n=1 Tax=Sunxiuqinia dokdonensis TaxID=1409788 RepID=A0A0L8V7J8_9BACT|nr:hypothetical protein [Sunxiuqinia dokdonensis]KOH44328.1 hypothetical protein NC99_28750 [Sunxiuqinia dokdonensis]